MGVCTVPDHDLVHLLPGEVPAAPARRRDGEEHLPDLLLVGHWDEGWVLLNPRVRTARGGAGGVVPRPLAARREPLPDVPGAHGGRASQGRGGVA
ncbi:hypothetical protein [Nonomuraea salmonea]|uniref:hypothetical protein n=1 Tax=Nonomuraea salmonea TaxID=46181 RepID=UPI0031EA4F72